MALGCAVRCMEIIGRVVGVALCTRVRDVGRGLVVRVEYFGQGKLIAFVCYENSAAWVG